MILAYVFLRDINPYYLERTPNERIVLPIPFKHLSILLRLPVPISAAQTSCQESILSRYSRLSFIHRYDAQKLPSHSKYCRHLL